LNVRMDAHARVHQAPEHVDVMCVHVHVHYVVCACACALIAQLQMPMHWCMRMRMRMSVVHGACAHVRMPTRAVAHNDPPLLRMT